MAWYNSSWLYRKKIVVDYSKVASNVTDFPVLVKLASDADLAAKALASGNDILITSSNGTTKLSHERVFFDNSTGELVLWFKAPSLSSSAGTDFYIYYGNSAASDQQDKTGVWKSEYKAVHHLGESTGNRNDSTTNANNLTPTSVTQSNGKIYKSASFDSTNPSVLEVASNASLQITGDLNASFWMNSSQPSSSIGETQSKRDGSTQSYGTRLVDFGNKEPGYLFTSTGSNFQSFTTGANDYTNGVWQLLHFQIQFGDTRFVKIYLNGTEIYSATFSSSLTQHYAGSEPFNIGARYTGSGYAGGYNGLMEESRLFSGVLSADWISTEHNNQNSPSTFYSLNAEETEAGTTSTSTTITTTSSSTTVTTSSTSTTTTTTSTSSSSTTSTSTTQSVTTSTSTSSSSTTSTSTTTLPAVCVLDQSYTASKDFFNYFGTTGTPQSGQQFTPSQEGRLCNINLTLSKDGSPSDFMRVEIWSLSGGVPDTQLAISDDQAAGSAIPAVFGEQVFSFNFTNGPYLNASTQYAMIFSRTGSLDDDNYYVPYAGSTGLYAGGHVISYNGSIWSENSAIDTWFQEYYDNTSATTTSTSSSTTTTTTSTSTSSSTTTTTTSTSSSTTTTTTSTSSSTSTTTTTTSTSSSTTITTTSTSSSSSTTTTTTSTSSSSTTSTSTTQSLTTSTSTTQTTTSTSTTTTTTSTSSSSSTTTTTTSTSSSTSITTTSTSTSSSTTTTTTSTSSSTSTTTTTTSTSSSTTVTTTSTSTTVTTSTSTSSSTTVTTSTSTSSSSSTSTTVTVPREFTVNNVVSYNIQIDNPGMD